MDALPSSAVDRRAAEETAVWGIANGSEHPVEIDDRSRAGLAGNG
jgi:hypothetical protein